MVAPLLLFLACAPAHISLGPGGASEDDSAGHVDTGDTDPGDTGDTDPGDSDSGDTGDTDDDAEPGFFTPPGGTFVEPFEVSLALESGERAWYTVDGSLPTDRDEPCAGPIAVRDGLELRVLVRDADGVEALHVGSWVRLDDGVAGFTSNLPLLLLYAEGDLDDAEGGYVPVSFQVHDVGDDGRSPLLGAASMSHRAALKVRGSSTASDPKHSWALELREDYADDDDDEALLGMPAESDWVLYAPLGFDRALIRNALVYRLSNDVGRYAPRTRFVEVFAVDRGGEVEERDYQGVYTLIERIKATPDRVAVAPLGPGDIAAPEVTGGYVFKRDRLGDDENGFGAGTAGGRFYFEDPLVYVDPGEDVLAREQADYLYGAVDEFVAALTSADHTSNGVHYRELIDVDAWIDHHILNLFPKNPDALRLSSYMYKDREGPIVAGPVWDFDRTMGCTDDDRARDPTWWDPTNETTDTTPMFTYGWYEPLFDDPEFAALYWARWRELIDDPLSDAHVGAVIDEMAAELEEAAPRNYDRWGDYRPAEGSFEGEIRALKAWMSARRAWIEGCLDTSDPESCRGD